ncbi:MAG TPA: glycoside hydrolase family 25 protein [Allosphingosinicella sp.]|jgi:GH25 family lysozyme M1 (1,4-beta-N-acetylmuramidase)
MTISSAIPIEGRVRIAAKANLRLGDASRQAPVVRKLDAGSEIQIHAIVVGEAVEGNSHWYQTDPNSYVWAGACGPLAPLGAGLVPLATSAPSIPAALSSPTGRTVPIVVDIYHADRVTSFTSARNSGVLGVIHKATTGATGRDDAYRDRRAAALDAGMLWGAYHWGTSRPAVDQVNNFLEWAQPDAHTLVALDFERDDGNQMSLQRAREVLAELANRLGRRPVIYSGSTLKDALGNTVDPFFGAHRLWLAQYGPTPEVQASWDKYWLWQYTDGRDGPGPRQAPGIPGNSRGELDCDHYQGSAEQLAQEWAS